MASSCLINSPSVSYSHMKTALFIYLFFKILIISSALFAPSSERFKGALTGSFTFGAKGVRELWCLQQKPITNKHTNWAVILLCRRNTRQRLPAWTKASHYRYSSKSYSERNSTGLSPHFLCRESMRVLTNFFQTFGVDTNISILIVSPFVA